MAAAQAAALARANDGLAAENKMITEESTHLIEELLLQRQAAEQQQLRALELQRRVDKLAAENGEFRRILRACEEMTAEAEAARSLLADECADLCNKAFADEAAAKAAAAAAAAAFEKLKNDGGEKYEAEVKSHEGTKEVHAKAFETATTEAAAALEKLKTESTAALEQERTDHAKTRVGAQQKAKDGAEEHMAEVSRLNGGKLATLQAQGATQSEVATQLASIQKDHGDAITKLSEANQQKMAELKAANEEVVDECAALRRELESAAARDRDRSGEGTTARAELRQAVARSAQAEAATAASFSAASELQQSVDRQLAETSVRYEDRLDGLAAAINIANESRRDHRSLLKNFHSWRQNVFMSGVEKRSESDREHVTRLHAEGVRKAEGHRQRSLERLRTRALRSSVRTAFSDWRINSSSVSRDSTATSFNATQKTLGAFFAVEKAEILEQVHELHAAFEASQTGAQALQAQVEVLQRRDERFTGHESRLRVWVVLRDCLCQWRGASYLAQLRSMKERNDLLVEASQRSIAHHAGQMNGSEERAQQLSADLQEATEVRTRVEKELQRVADAAVSRQADASGSAQVIAQLEQQLTRERALRGTKRQQAIDRFRRRRLLRLLQSVFGAWVELDKRLHVRQVMTVRLLHLKRLRFQLAAFLGWHASCCVSVKANELATVRKQTLVRHAWLAFRQYVRYAVRMPVVTAAAHRLRRSTLQEMSLLVWREHVALASADKRRYSLLLYRCIGRIRQLTLRSSFGSWVKLWRGGHFRRRGGHFNALKGDQSAEEAEEGIPLLLKLLGSR